jgi:phytoene synthase
VKPLTSERGAPPGSLRYFAVLFAPPAARPVLEALYDFEAEIRDTIDTSSHEAAHARVQWWRGEIDRLAAGHASHPIAIALQPVRQRRDVDLGLLHETLVAADLDLARMSYQNWPELEAYCVRAAGALQTIAAAVLAGDRAVSEDERRFARKLGSAQRQVEMIRDVRRDLRRGRLYLPLEVVESAGITPTDLQQPTPPASLGALIAEWRTRVAGALDELPGSLPERTHRTAQRHGLVLGALHTRLLEEITTRSGSDDVRVELGPFARLWTAWRTAVRHG